MTNPFTRRLLARSAFHRVLWALGLLAVLWLAVLWAVAKP